MSPCGFNVGRVPVMQRSYRNGIYVWFHCCSEKEEQHFKQLDNGSKGFVKEAGSVVFWLVGRLKLHLHGGLPRLFGCPGTRCPAGIFQIATSAFTGNQCPILFVVEYGKFMFKKMPRV